jgi:hypothetical protein
MQSVLLKHLLSLVLALMSVVPGSIQKPSSTVATPLLQSTPSGGHGTVVVRSAGGAFVGAERKPRPTFCGVVAPREQ